MKTGSRLAGKRSTGSISDPLNSSSRSMRRAAELDALRTINEGIRLGATL